MKKYFKILTKINLIWIFSIILIYQSRVLLSGEIYYEMGKVCDQENEIGESYEYYELSIFFDPITSKAYYEYGKAGLEYWNYCIVDIDRVPYARRSAIKYFKKTIRAYPNHLGAYIGIAEASLSIADKKMALKYINLALELSPKNSQALKLKGDILLQENPCESLFFYSAVLKEELDNEDRSNYHYNVGRINYLIGDSVEAMKNFNSFIDFRKESKEYFDDRIIKNYDYGKKLEFNTLKCN